MKLLTLIRHAKSSWAHPELDDIDRPLNARGLKAAPLMGQRLAVSRKDWSGVRMFTSPARRARDTAELIAAELSLSAGAITELPHLYTFDARELLLAIRTLPDDSEAVLLVAHNPAITEVANLLTGAQIDNVPTAGMVSMSLDIPGWRQAAAGDAILLEFDYPKRT